MKDRVFFRKTDIIIIGLIAIISIAIIFTGNESGGYASVSVDGQRVLKIDFDGNYTVYDINSTPSLSVSYSEGGVAIINANCDDKLCEATGHLNSGGQMAVCLPGSVVLEVHAESEVDYIAS